MSIVIPLPWSKPPLTGNRTRGNPYARAAEVKTAKAEAVQAIATARPGAVVAANVTLHFRPPTKRRRDADGMYPTLKVVQDALVLSGVIPDDSWVCVPRSACEIHPPDAALDQLGSPPMWLTLDVLKEFGATP